MEFSKHNIISKIKNTDKHYIVNVLSGNADFLEKSEFEELQNSTENLKIDLARKEEQIKNLIDNIQIQRITYEELQIPLTIYQYCGVDVVKK